MNDYAAHTYESRTEYDPSRTINDEIKFRIAAVMMYLRSAIGCGFERAVAEFRVGYG